MTLEQLRVLEHIVECGSVLAAANRLNRSQPALSVSIKKLEKEFDINILSRDSFRASVTTEGHALYQKAKVILSHSKAFATLAKQLSKGCETAVRIAYPAFLSIDPMLDILRECQSQHPHTRVMLSSYNLEGGVDRLLDNKADIALVPTFDDINKIESHYFMRTPFITACAPSLLVDLDINNLSMEEMRHVAHIVVSENDNNDDYSKNIECNLDESRQWIVNDLESKKNLLLAGLGWGRLPARVISDELIQGDLVSIDIDGYDTVVQREVRIARRADQPLGPVTAMIWEWLLEHSSSQKLV